ncbi:hypothetical protein Acry_1101 [Acidiphilium cryptum JF-5]|uniref:Uncharacterized protein n=2 Tax=Acidocellaceae TaxID=3385905 RepID=A5FXI4_ACICJ|nr:hypothetical protein Acry_1101 [Acidiphilium cryptum JF-5]
MAPMPGRRDLMVDPLLSDLTRPGIGAPPKVAGSDRRIRPRRLHGGAIRSSVLNRLTSQRTKKHKQAYSCAGIPGAVDPNCSTMADSSCFCGTIVELPKFCHFF